MLNSKLIRPWRAVAVTTAVLAASATAAAASSNSYCDPLGGCTKHPTHYIQASPGTAKAGHSTKLSGAVGHGCKLPGQVTIYSRAFNGATRHSFAGVPAIFTRTDKKGKFAIRITIKKSVKAGSYRVGARCGGGNFGSTTLKVKH